MSVVASFAEYLKPSLSLDSKVRIHHVSSEPTTCPPLYSAAPGQNDETTWCESHFLIVSQPSATSEQHVIILGVEVVIFMTRDLTTIFVSKADSTGFLTRQDDSYRGRQSLVRETVATFLQFLIHPRLLRDHRLVLSLFARSQNQYLFPGSVENSTKHVLNDRQLIKWWCRLLDPIVRTQSEHAASPNRARAYLVVPGCDKSETTGFFPTSVHTDTGADSIWINRYPVDLLVKDMSLPPRCMVPRFPDDPKARFLDDLDGTRVDKHGKWRGITSLDQFWEMMSYRQECSAGRVVGFIWIVFDSHTKAEHASKDKSYPASKADKAQQASEHGTTAMQNTESESTAASDESPRKEMIDSVIIDQPHSIGQYDGDKQRNVTDMSGKDSTSPGPIISGANRNADKQPPFVLSETKGQIVLNHDGYSKLMDHLLQLDFAGIDLAQQSTTDWINKAKELAAVTDFGIDVVGGFIPKTVDVAQQPVTQVANVLTAVRKKRKATLTEPTSVPSEVERPATVTLDANLLRKKAKSDNLERTDMTAK